ncbi:ribose 5-phosphate isomerase A [Dysgonomonas sp. 511]|uniref:ribose 5-phosphate isomerase A n=1 Tax=Dysgonomonas sp. 511 TaxID=2302930 RepID=UPI0013D346DF|nr:ribose 5-phosphate isomerase A [Dysgonomonas sp. 511]NDV78310.1 ribose 5-phosphate isomerase A [Dysgonomonas sp. 511]
MKQINTVISRLQWSADITNRERKERVALLIANMMRDGQVIGAGSGSTVYVAMLAIAEKVKRENLDIEIIPASHEISMTCVQLGLRQTTLWEKTPDWTFDGADEVDPQQSLIKGRGGAMFKEKLLICNSKKTFIIVDQSKFVGRLGEKFPVPVEVFPQSLVYVEQQLEALGARDITLRMAKGKDGPVITENGNFVLDAWFDNIDPLMEKKIKNITGVIESGLFIGYNVEILKN